MYGKGNYMLTVTIVLLGAGLIAVAAGTMTKSKWGINLKAPAACPQCETPIPKGPRVPSDSHEAMWGGWTCKACGTKLDKWGRTLAS